MVGECGVSFRLGVFDYLGSGEGEFFYVSMMTDMMMDMGGEISLYE